MMYAQNYQPQIVIHNNNNNHNNNLNSDGWGFGGALFSLFLIIAIIWLAEHWALFALLAVVGSIYYLIKRGRNKRAGLRQRADYENATGSVYGQYPPVF